MHGRRDEPRHVMTAAKIMLAGPFYPKSKLSWWEKAWTRLLEVPPVFILNRTEPYSFSFK